MTFSPDHRGVLTWLVKHVVFNYSVVISLFGGEQRLLLLLEIVLMADVCVWNTSCWCVLVVIFFFFFLQNGFSWSSVRQSDCVVCFCLRVSKTFFSFTLWEQWPIYFVSVRKLRWRCSHTHTHAHRARYGDGLDRNNQHPLFLYRPNLHYLKTISKTKKRNGYNHKRWDDCKGGSGSGSFSAVQWCSDKDGGVVVQVGVLLLSFLTLFKYNYLTIYPCY